MPFHYPDDSSESASPAAGPLKPYDVTIRGTETTLLLNDEDAKREGLLAEKVAPPKRNKARQAPNKKD